MSDFHPDTKGVVVDTFLGSLVQSHCGEGGTLQTNNTGVCSQCLSHTGPAPAHSTRALPAHTAQALGCFTGNHPRLALGCMHLPGLSRSGSGTRVVLRGAGSVGPAFCALPRSEPLRWWGVWWASLRHLLPRPCCSVFWVYSQCTFTGRCPEPQEVLAKKPACSLVDNVSLGLQLPPSSSGCLSQEGDGLQLANSVQSFVLCTGLAVS